MKRLTKKAESQYIIECPNLLNYIDGKDQLNEFLSTQDKGIQKLGELEDIEEELGIDLATLINALTCGIWLRNGNKLEHHKVFLCKSDGNFALGYDWSDKYGLQGWCLKTKKYRQHWALTKEELE